MTHAPDSPAAMLRLLGADTPTPLLSMPELAARCGVAQVLVKSEDRRLLGNFKSLGGMYAGLRALARAAGVDSIAALLERAPTQPLPPLVCASDGNHGLAVAAAARHAGAGARIYLHEAVAGLRADRIASQGAEIVRVPGTYDDAVREAATAAARGEGLLIADTSEDKDDPVVNDVMGGYDLLVEEIAVQLSDFGAAPTHAFLQAGVGGLAAAVAGGLVGRGIGAATVIVEPEGAACVAAALVTGRPEQLSGSLETSAEMLSCGLASGPALTVLRDLGAHALAVEEPWLHEARAAFPSAGGPVTTESGAAGLAGLLKIAADAEARHGLGLDAEARVLLIVTEGPA